MYGNIEEAARIIVKGLLHIMRAFVALRAGNPNDAYKELR